MYSGWRSRYHYRGILANSADPDEMAHKRSALLAKIHSSDRDFCEKKSIELYILYSKGLYTS